MSFDGESAGNAAEIEMQFAVKTVEHLEAEADAQAYEKLLGAIPPSKMKLTPMDDDIHANFLELFPEYKIHDALRVLDEDKMKTAAGKERWRSFIMPYEGKLTDYNFGTLVRKDADKPYGEDNCILVTRVQFFGIEIARNRAGLNDNVYKAAQEAKSKSS